MAEIGLACHSSSRITNNSSSITISISISISKISSNSSGGGGVGGDMVRGCVT